MLTKIVNGKEVGCSPEEEAVIRAEWAKANEVAVEEAAVQVAADIKKARSIAVEAITITTQAGNVFDGDETAQTRMARAILVLGLNTIQWKLADNTFITTDVVELNEALALAGQAQAELWVTYG